jgi:sulfonate transport system ATP-binding protein
MDINITEINELETASTGRRGVGVHAENINKQFGVRHVLRDLDLSIRPGEFVAIVGHSGCGKSTLLRLLAGLDQASSGHLDLDGKPLQGINPDVRIMFQDSRLLPWRTVIENVGLGLEGDWRSAAQNALKQVGLADRAHEWPAALSGGQRQRVALARALVHEPRLLLLDEPLGALDALTRIEMQRLIERLWLDKGFTALLVTHDVPEAIALADRVVLIEHGAITLDQKINLPRRRERGTAEFAKLEGLVLSRVMGIEEVVSKNQFKGEISAILSDDPVLSSVLVETEHGTVTATISTRSIAEYGFEVGSEVLALVKANKVEMAIPR